MYRLLIVEDESTIAHGIAESIPWEQWGFQVIGICGDGEEALAFIEKDRPDIVLSDIRMPKMDGIALMEYLHKHAPDIKMIILSGYSDFEYLQRSIRNHVTEYLLKPTDVDEFEEAFARLKKQMDEERKQERSQEILHEQQMMNALLKGYGYDEEAVDERFYQKENACFGVAIFRLDALGSCDAVENAQALFEQKQAVCAALRASRPAYEKKIRAAYFCNFEEEISGIFELDEGCEEALMEAVSCAMEAVEASCLRTVSAGISKLYDDYRMLPQCYEQAKCCIGQMIYSQRPQTLLRYAQLEKTVFDYDKITFDDSYLLHCILNEDVSGMKAALATVFDKLRDKVVPDYRYADRLAEGMLLAISRKMLKYQLRPEKLMHEHGYAYVDLAKKRTLAEKEQLLGDIFELFTAECARQQEKNSKTGELARLIRAIVDEEYASNQISLEYLAERVHKSTAYISKIFKNEFACNFSTYVTEKRLEKSRELLEDPLRKVYEIAGELGWADVSNYIKLFRKKYGMSPEEYRRKLTKQV